MRVRPLFFAAAAATVFACTGSNPDVTVPGTGSGIGSQGGGVQNAGQPDAGNPDTGLPDAGTGCNTQALPLSAVAAKETCRTGDLNGTTETIITAGCNDVTITGGVDCHGVLIGP